MVLYNVTVNVAADVVKEWKNWMKNIHIPEVLATGKFQEHRFLKMISEHPDAEGETFAIQYMASDMGALEDYLTNDAPSLQQKHVDKYGEKCLAFRTVLEEV